MTAHRLVAAVASALSMSSPAASQNIDYQQSVSVQPSAGTMCNVGLCRVTLAPVPPGYKLLVTYVGVTYRLQAPSADTTVYLTMNDKPSLLYVPLASPPGTGPAYTSTTVLAAWFPATFAPTVNIYGPGLTGQTVRIAVVGTMGPAK